MNYKFYIKKDSKGVIHVLSCLNEEDMMASVEADEGFVDWIKQEEIKTETPKEMMERLRNDRCKQNN